MTLLQSVKIQYYNVVQNVFMTRTIERYPIYLFKYYLTVHAYFNTYMNLKLHTPLCVYTTAVQQVLEMIRLVNLSAVNPRRTLCSGFIRRIFQEFGSLPETNRSFTVVI